MRSKSKTLSRVEAWILASALLALLSPRVAWPVDPDAVAKSVGDKVYCLCGCVTTLNHCPHPEAECSIQRDMHKLIRKDLAEGKSENLILGDFVLRYGAQVLASPPAKGFDLTVWVLPGFGAIVGLVIVVLLIRRFRKPKENPSPPETVDPKLLAAVEEEMKKVVG
jgi:cytochrome c-type biogenesis protein CcmH/NrfF